MTNTNTEELLKELIQRDQFVNYIMEQKGDRITKPPTDANGYKIDAQNSNNWRSFQDAYNASDQIGFVLTDDDPFLFLDLDHVLKDGKLCDWAEELIAELPATYIEISPSGDGLHILYKLYDTPDLKTNKRKFDDGTVLEIYFNKRYFTLTGNVYHATAIATVNSGDLIMKTLEKFMNWQQQLTLSESPSNDAANDASFTSTEKGGGITDKEVLSILYSSKNGQKAKKLYAGDMSEYNHDHSSAELGLINYLVFYTQDKQQLNRLYANSSLSRDKWDEPHSSDGRTYGEMTLQKAIDDCEHFYKPKQATAPTRPRSKFRLTPIKEILNRTFGLDMVIENILPLGSLACLYGEPAGGKSFAALDIAYCISQGIPWHGRKVEQGPVIYIAGEGLDGIAKRIKALAAKYGCDDPKDFYLSNGSIDLADNKTVQSLLDELSGKTPIKLIVIDTMHRNFTGDENSAKDIAVLVKHADDLTEQTGAAILIVHHSGKSKNAEARGSSALKAALDVEIMVTNGKGVVTLKNTKMKDLKAFEPLHFKLTTKLLDERDKQGNPVSSAVLESTDAPPFFTSSSASKNALLLQTLVECIEANDEPIATDNDFKSNDGQSIVNTNDKKMMLKSDFYEQCKHHIKISTGSAKPDEAKKKSFNRSIKELKESEQIAESSNKYLIVT
jgi:putative DNA primase/helicase